MNFSPLLWLLFSISGTLSALLFPLLLVILFSSRYYHSDWLLGITGQFYEFAIRPEAILYIKIFLLVTLLLTLYQGMYRLKTAFFDLKLGKYEKIMDGVCVFLFLIGIIGIFSKIF